MSILDFLFPKKCVICKKLGSFLCPDCFTKLSFDVKSLCLICNKPNFDGLTHSKCSGEFTIDGCFSALSYNKTARKLIYSFKHKPFLTGLKDVLSDLFYESIIQNENFMKLIVGKRWIIVPVPLSKSKLRERGYNQSEFLVKELSKRFGFPIGKIQEKTRNTNIILIDDIVNTGSTLLEITDTLKKAGAKTVIGLALIRSRNTY